MSTHGATLDGVSTALINVPIDNNISNGYFPIGLGYIASTMRQAGVHVDALDPHSQGLDDDATIRHLEALVRDQDCRFFGISSMVTGYARVKWLATNIRRLCPDAVIYAGGSISTVADLLLTKSEVDVVCIGEGEFTAIEILEAKLGKRDIATVEGIVYKADGAVHKTPARSRIDELGDVPFPAWDLFNMEPYITTPKIVQGVSRGMSVIATRGCPFRCGFCFRNFGQLVRCRPPEDVVAELREIKERFNVTHVEFLDELFTQSPKHTMKLCAAMAEADLGMTWRCLSRVHPVSTEMFQIMYDAGCRWIGFGLESGSQTVLDAMEKGVKIEHAKNAIRLARSVGLHTSGTFIMGYPGETEVTVHETIEFCREMELANAPFYPIPFPGTALYEKLKLMPGGVPDDEEAFIAQISGNASDLLINVSEIPDDKLRALREEWIAELGQFFPALIHPDAERNAPPPPQAEAELSAQAG